MIPLFVDLSGKRVVIFGGGTVAARKAVFFLQEADVWVVSRSFSRQLMALPVRRTILAVSATADSKLTEIISGAFIVVAALSDKSLNDHIGDLCKRNGILFNNADGKRGDLIVPSVSSGKRYTIAITTLGKSPAISRFMRENLDERFELLDSMIELQDNLRTDLKRSCLTQTERRSILWNIIRDPNVWDALSRSQKEGERIAREKYLHG